jgi:hypothetical protein
VGSLFGRSNNFYSYLNRPHRYSGPPSHLFVVYIEPYFGGCSGRGVNLTSHLHLAPSLRITGVTISLLHLPSWSAHVQICPSTPDKILHVSYATPHHAASPSTSEIHVRNLVCPEREWCRVRSSVVCSNLTHQPPSPTKKELFSSRTD